MTCMKKRPRASTWAKSFERSLNAMTRLATASGARALKKTLKPAVARRTPPPGAGAWIPGVVMGAAGARRFRLYRPPEVQFGERLPLMVMLHGCGQDANSFAASTRMNRIAMRERRRIAARNLGLCFPDLDERARTGLLRRHFAMRSSKQCTAS